MLIAKNQEGKLASALETSLQRRNPIAVLVARELSF